MNKVELPPEWYTQKVRPWGDPKNTANSLCSNTNKPFTLYMQPSTTTKHCWTNFCLSWLLYRQLCGKPWHNRCFSKAIYMCVPGKILYHSGNENYLCEANLCAKIFSVFSLIILAGLLKYTTFFYIPYLPFSACRFQASWDPFDHIWYLRALLLSACFLYFDLTVVKITFFSRKSSVDYFREPAAGNHQMQLPTGPLGWSGAGGEGKLGKSCASWASLPEKVCLRVINYLTSIIYCEPI